METSVFLGAPGSGKGTQAKRLAEEQGFIHLSTGDLLRAAIKAGTELGQKAKAIIDRGDLVPDGTMIALIEETFRDLPSHSKIILDGFPRTEAQAVALDSSKSSAVKHAIYFQIPENILVNRLTGRRICTQCGEPFHIKFVPPKIEGKCDKCGGALLQRSDDQEEVVKRRLEVFQKSNQQLLDYYQRTHRLKQVVADGDVAVIQAALSGIMN